MAEEFNPAPHDKHAADPRRAAAADRDIPVSAAQPSPSRADQENVSLWDKAVSVFR